MPPPYIIFWSMNVFHFAVKSITYRYGADRSIFQSGILTWVLTYPPKPAAYGSSERYFLHTRMLE